MEERFSQHVENGKGIITEDFLYLVESPFLVVFFAGRGGDKIIPGEPEPKRVNDVADERGCEFDIPTSFVLEQHASKGFGVAKKGIRPYSFYPKPLNFGT